MPRTYNSLATTTVSGSASSVTISDISSAYTDLIIVVRCSLNGISNVNLKVGTGNTIDTNQSNYQNKQVMCGTAGGTTRSFYYGTDEGLKLDFYATGTGNVKQFQANLFNYSSTAKQKTILIRSSLPQGGSDREVVNIVGTWANTAAINCIRITPDTTTFQDGTMVTVYGILEA